MTQKPMDVRFSPHNTHLEYPDEFSKRAPHLARLGKMPLAHTSGLINELPIDTPGIYTLGGGRQVGKTTLTKQWMSRLLEKNIPPPVIRYLSGELIDDHHSLMRHLTEIIDETPGNNDLRYIILDEVTYIKDWDKGIKFLADAGLLVSMDALFIQQALSEDKLDGFVKSPISALRFIPRNFTCI